ncbi:PP2C family protein-serine/threonine phosphatase [Natronoglycomyces albus]|uniref:Serine/threonine-protein phosphatase n=1 Tax=Natronoglycomyces albus TaxID=2811108 RepID=A0A895XPA9_9ACTN|nr:PP2C family protein-serine/threonine phosphatase [Natronoglycomyces albus]QSB05383.1 serine/threonine-protein phosphatase [Natronoglycomyces albus]
MELHPRGSDWSAPAVRYAFAAAFALLMLAIAVSIWENIEHSIIGLMALPPLAAAAFLAWPWILSIGIVALLLGITYHMVASGSEVADTSGNAMQLVVVFIAVLIAVAIAALRERETKRIQQLTRLASVTQQAILRPLAPRIGPFNIAARYVSSGSHTEIGGDLYEVADTDYGQRVIIGDVRGKGLSAIRLTSTVLGAFRYVAYERADYRNMVKDLDQAVTRGGGEEDFVTVALLEQRGGTLQIINCGHPSPMLLRQGKVSYLKNETMAPPLGLMPTVTVRTERLEPGDRILLYTDGLSEARRDGEFFPIDKRAAKLLGHGSVSDGLASLETALRRWVYGPLSDDIALVLLEYSPRS